MQSVAGVSSVTLEYQPLNFFSFKYIPRYFCCCFFGNRFSSSYINHTFTHDASFECFFFDIYLRSNARFFFVLGRVFLLSFCIHSLQLFCSAFVGFFRSFDCGFSILLTCSSISLVSSRNILPLPWLCWNDLFHASYRLNVL